MKLADLPAIGHPLDTGVFAGLTTTREGIHCAVVLLGDKPDGDLAWKPAMAWAENLGAGAQLPTRPVAALLFANLKAHFADEWHWTSEESSGSYAWFQFFFNGYQSSSHESFEGCARAVRLIQLTA